MNKKIVTIVVILVILAIAGWLVYQNQRQPVGELQSLINSESKTTQLSAEIEAVLDQKIKLLEDLAVSPKLVAAVEASNAENSGLSMDRIIELDNKWQSTEGTDDFINQYLTNETALELLQFQEDNPGFPEIFVTDAIGLNVGQTNKTSDYYQADEDWWVQAFNSAKGKSYHGEIEYDESAQSESVALYVPIYDSAGKAIGVIKAILSIITIQREL